MKKFLFITILSVVFHNTFIQSSAANQNTLRSAAPSLIGLQIALAAFKDNSSNRSPLEDALDRANRSRDVLVNAQSITYQPAIQAFDSLISNATTELNK